METFELVGALFYTMNIIILAFGLNYAFHSKDSKIIKLIKVALVFIQWNAYYQLVSYVLLNKYIR